MPSLSGVGGTVLWLFLLWARPAAQRAEVRCSEAGPVGARHPVQGLLERFEVGPGCAARERGNKETHVIALGGLTNSPENKVTVLLKPLSTTPSPLRALHLLLSSRFPVTWSLVAERLPPNLPVLVQVSSNSTVQSRTLRLHVEMMDSLPFHAHALHHWALEHHGSLSSLMQTAHGNRIYVRVGEDPTLPTVCQLQSTFPSQNYMTSDLQPQNVRRCAHNLGVHPEVHVIKLHSSGSGLSGSQQAEVVVTLVPLVADSKAQKVVLILSSWMPVSWAVIAHGVRGHIFVHSSNSVSPLNPSQPDLILSTTVNSDLSTISDLLAWASESGYTNVTSYTEADLANRFVIQLAEGGTEESGSQWWSDGGSAGVDGKNVTVKCEDRRLSVTVDQRILQRMSAPTGSTTLQNLTCQARTNGSHFLLDFPVTSCETDTQVPGEPRGKQYQNTVLLWRDEPRAILALNETEKSESLLSMIFTCLAAPPRPPAAAADDDNVPQTTFRYPGSGSDARLPIPRHRSGPVLLLKLFVTASYERTRIGPCVVTADHRVYVEISAKAPFADVVQVKSCVVSPLSDPKKTPFWPVISDGCSSDPSLILRAKTNEEQPGEAEGDGEVEEEKEEGLEQAPHIADRGGRDARTGERISNVGDEEAMQPLRFSFILRPIYKDAMQFLHCSLHLCASNSTRGNPMKETVKNDCQDGLRIPPLVSRSSRHQCEIRNLSRPMVVTQPISALAPKMRTNRLRLTPPTGPDPAHNCSAVHTVTAVGTFFAAFVSGLCLMRGLCYICTGAPASFNLPVSQSPEHLEFAFTEL